MFLGLRVSSKRTTILESMDACQAEGISMYDTHTDLVAQIAT